MSPAPLCLDSHCRNPAWVVETAPALGSRRRAQKIGAKNIASNLENGASATWPLLIEFCLPAVWAFTFAHHLVAGGRWCLIFVLPENPAGGAHCSARLTGLVAGLLCLMQYQFEPCFIERA